MRSISRRIRHTYLFISIVIILVMAVVTVLISEDLESTMMELDFAADRDFFLQRSGHQDQPRHWKSAQLEVYYQPASESKPGALPPLFQEIDQHFSGEIVYQGQTYLMDVSPAGDGVLYMAKDISRIEKREILFLSVILLTALGLVGVSFLLSHLESRRLVRPLRRLSEEIRAIPIGARMPRLMEDFSDSELNHIATTFNAFLRELESFVRREKTLISLASHELSTPIAVVSGALDVLEERGQLKPRDAQTLARIRQATTDIQQNVQALLALSRRSGKHPPAERLELPVLIEEVIEDLAAHYPVFERLDLEMAHGVTQTGDATLVKMLLRNLIQNALQHTSGHVLVRLQQDQLVVLDEGQSEEAGTRLQQIQALTDADDPGALGGLGLYIAHVLCDRLGWMLRWQPDRGTGQIVIHFSSGALPDSASTFPDGALGQVRSSSRA